MSAGRRALSVMVGVSVGLDLGAALAMASAAPIWFLLAGVIALTIGDRLFGETP